MSSPRQPAGFWQQRRNDQFVNGMCEVSIWIHPTPLDPIQDIIFHMHMRIFGVLLSHTFFYRQWQIRKGLQLRGPGEWAGRWRLRAVLWEEAVGWPIVAWIHFSSVLYSRHSKPLGVLLPGFLNWSPAKWDCGLILQVSLSSSEEPDSFGFIISHVTVCENIVCALE